MLIGYVLMLMVVTAFIVCGSFVAIASLFCLVTVVLLVALGFGFSLFS